MMESSVLENVDSSAVDRSNGESRKLWQTSAPYNTTVQFGEGNIGDTQYYTTVTEFQESDENKKACDIIVRIITPNTEGIPETVHARYVSNRSAENARILIDAGAYSSEFWKEEDQNQSSPPYGKGKGGKMMRTKVNGQQLDYISYGLLSTYSPDVARKKRIIQLLNDNSIFFQCEEAAALLSATASTIVA